MRDGVAVREGRGGDEDGGDAAAGRQKMRGGRFDVIDAVVPRHRREFKSVGFHGNRTASRRIK
jgi:hypothetical protein